jgi:2-polyprenyl-3-methyl-5-hydroxy-6-metoxy-1,4-benzoquinol methylase
MSNQITTNLGETPGDEWFLDAGFWEEYAPIMFDDQRWAEVPEVADGVSRLARLKLYGDEALRLSPGSRGPRVLDLCCGFGRITLELARRGFEAAGVDITEAYLRCAREDAAFENLEIEFIHADGRTVRRPGFVDLAVK